MPADRKYDAGKYPSSTDPRAMQKVKAIRPHADVQRIPYEAGCNQYRIYDTRFVNKVYSSSVVPFFTEEAAWNNALWHLLTES